MSLLITGTLHCADDVREALTALLGEGFGSGEIASFPFGSGLSEPAAACAGSLVGALSRLGDPEHPDHRDEAVADPAVADRDRRQAGMVIAVAVRMPGRRDAVIAILRRCSATDLEATEGRIVDGQWVDFDRDAPLNRLAD